MQLKMLLLIAALIILSVISVIGLSSSFAQVNSNNSVSSLNSSLWKTVTSDKFGISFEYPSDWTLIEKTNRFDPSADITVYSGLNDFSFLNHKKSLDDKLSYMSFENVAAEGLRIFTQGEGKRIIEDVQMNKYKIDGKDTATFLYTFETPIGTQEASQIFLVNYNNKIYEFAYKDSVNDFDSPKSQSIMNHIINSIHFS